jgi:hypothetical protein
MITSTTAFLFSFVFFARAAPANFFATAHNWVTAFNAIRVANSLIPLTCDAVIVINSASSLGGNGCLSCWNLANILVNTATAFVCVFGGCGYR